MPTIACHTLGCKVNQYDTQAMLELFLQRGYTPVSMEEEADVYLLNTCTVTGTGDKKSLQMARRLKRLHPGSRLILCGCLAQKSGDSLLSRTGADLILGTQRRAEVVDLLEQVLSDGKPRCAVEPLAQGVPFESLRISYQEEHTRASLKIQEGCDNHCTYCIIPSVRGPIRSRTPESVGEEARRLSAHGVQEIVLTGIHLSSYGRDLSPRCTLLEAIAQVQRTEGITRIRLGSLEPMIATPAFAAALREMDKICPQFHLALQSGSDSVLRRMKRQYNTSQYLAAAENLRNAFPRAALTTDILTGFPGETEEEFQETARMIEQVGFARIHVFPYSPRPDTPAAVMPDPISRNIKDERVRKLIRVGNRCAEKYLKTWIGAEAQIIPEEIIDGCWEGYTPEYIRVRLCPGASCTGGRPVQVRLVSVRSGLMLGEPVSVSPVLPHEMV